MSYDSRPRTANAHASLRQSILARSHANVAASPRVRRFTDESQNEPPTPLPRQQSPLAHAMRTGHMFTDSTNDTPNLHAAHAPGRRWGDLSSDDFGDQDHTVYAAGNPHSAHQTSHSRFSQLVMHSEQDVKPTIDLPRTADSVHAFSSHDQRFPIVSQRPQTSYQPPEHPSATHSHVSTGESSLELSSVLGEIAKAHEVQKHELQQQTAQLQALKTQVETLQNEKDELSKKYSGVKARTQRIVAESQKCVRELKIELESLQQEGMRHQSADWINELTNEVAEMRRLAEDGVLEIQSIVSHCKEVADTTEISQLVADLETSANNKQGVIDILRDQLQMAGSETLEYKERIHALEGAVKMNSLLLDTSKKECEEKNLKANVLATELKSTEKELDRLLEENHRLRNEVAADKQVVSELHARYDAEHGLMQEKLVRIETMCSELQQMERRLKESSESREELRSENQRLLQEIARQESEASKLRDTVHFHKSMLEQKELTLKGREKELVALNLRCQKAEAHGDALRKEIQDARISEGRIRENLLKATTRLETLEVTRAEEISTARRELENALLRAQDQASKHQVVRDRLEEQTVNLRLSKESAAQLQDRLVECEARYSSEKEKACGDLRSQMAILLVQIDTLKENSARLELELAAMKQRQEDVQQEQSKRLEDANNQCKDSLQLQLQAVESHRMASDKWHLDERTYSNTIEHLQKQIADLQATISATPDIQDLHNQISALANENQAMKMHAAGALDRLNTSTLDEHERGLVKKVYDSTVESHKMEIAEKNNEISRRDRRIQELEGFVEALRKNQEAKKLVDTRPGIIDPDILVATSSSEAGRSHRHLDALSAGREGAEPAFKHSRTPRGSSPPKYHTANKTKQNFTSFAQLNSAMSDEINEFNSTPTKIARDSPVEIPQETKRRPHPQADPKPNSKKQKLQAGEDVPVVKSKRRKSRRT